MTNAKTPKFLILFVVLALAGAAVVAGCGGSSSSSEAATTVEEEVEGGIETEEEGASEEETGGAEAEGTGKSEEGGEAEEGGGESAALSAEGKTIFTSTCGSCHTLKEAGTSGEVGPNLDELEPSLGTVEKQVEEGGGGMPAFGKEGILKSNEIKAVATYVSSVAGTE
jgi:mono/diheme cytochrome c family protein